MEEKGLRRLPLNPAAGAIAVFVDPELHRLAARRFQQEAAHGTEEVDPREVAVGETKNAV
jgi:hypothetical protein